MRSTPELLINRLELRGRLLKVAELVLAPASDEASQPIGTDALRAKSLPEKVDDRLVERFAPLAFLALKGVSKTRWQIPDRQCLDGYRLLRLCIQ
jgi:hypothetical protein